MKPTLLVILAFLSIPLHAQKTLGEGTRELAVQITASAAKQEKQRIAVLPFHELDGQPTVLGTYLAEELVTNLFQLGNFKIVERQLLDKVMGELKVEQSGAIDRDTAKEIGRIAAVDAIVTGSITDLESFVAVNCRLIDTTTGEVFGAAQTKITKDEDVNKIMRTALTPGSATAFSNGPSYQAAKAIATKDIGLLRVALKSAVTTRQAGSNGRAAMGIRCSFEFTNRDTQRSIFVGFNAIPGEPGPVGAYGGYSGQPRLIGDVEVGDVLRTTLVDETGVVWTLSASGVTGISIVSAGKRDAYSVFSPADVPSLLRRQDETGTNMTSDSRGLSPNQPFAFVFGSPTEIPPGQSVTVPMGFAQRAGEVVSSAPRTFQIMSEIVVGVATARAKTSYSLQNLTFDRVSLPARGD